MGDGALNIVVVDANRTVRKGTELLVRSWDHHVVGVADDADRGYELAVRRCPQVVLADAASAGPAAYGLARRIATEQRDTAVVLQLDRPAPAEVEQALSCGARGVTLRSDEPEELRRALAVAAGGGRHVTDTVERRADATPAHGRPLLSNREREVLRLLAHGANGHDAARLLEISPDTLRKHVKNAMRKLGARTRVQAVTLALVSGELRL